MDKNNMFRKGLVCGIIVLFVGASVTPGISGDIRKSSKVEDVKDFENEKLQSVKDSRIIPAIIPASDKDISIKSNGSCS